MIHRPWLFEGIPGSGKTTLSRAVSDALRGGGRPCEWALEEDPDHPLFGRDLRRSHRQAGYDERCLDAWRATLIACRHTSWSLDGCAWQSTVRYMFEQDWPSDRIDEYWQRFADLVTPSGAVLIDLRHPDTEWFLRNHTVEVRADVWEKISTHVRSTPVGRRMETEGADTPVEFWIRYRAVCDRLAGLGLIHRLELDLADGWPMTAEDLIAAVDAA